MWNVRTWAVALAALVLFLLLSLPALRKKPGRVLCVAAPVAAAVLACAYVFYVLPTEIAYPLNFNIGKESIFSTAFIYRFIGYLLGLILALVTAIAMYQGARRMGWRAVFPIMAAAMLLNAFQQVTKGLSVLYSKRIITGHDLFVFISKTKNMSNVFIYAAMALALIVPVVLCVRSLRAHEPYSNPAEHRKIRAKWRSARRWSATLCACFLIGVLTLTVFYAIDNQEVQLSPEEAYEMEDEENIYVSLLNVQDGHLHRFSYKTENGVGVRFIVIKKPNSNAYGIGLDACDICGETGYFERGGQVVCKLCDVVMNINTIGFKGGCNPIVFDYTIKDGYIVIAKETLAAFEKTFK
ncbi:MAG: DUF2318 domain-containing protein [Clostridia bacterium]|nr:DUF2318 domain-containing protein [Clostridia bacterium]